MESHYERMIRSHSEVRVVHPVSLPEKIGQLRIVRLAPGTPGYLLAGTLRMF